VVRRQIGTELISLYGGSTVPATGSVQRAKLHLAGNLGAALYLVVFRSQAYWRNRLSGLSRRHINTRLVGSQGSIVRGLLVRMRIGTVLIGT